MLQELDENQTENQPILSSSEESAASPRPREATQRKKPKRLYESAKALNPHQSEVELKREMQQRKTASDRERGRMQDMNNAFEMLRGKLAHRRQPGKKMSKIQSLRFAIEYISDLEETLTMTTHMPNGGNAYFQWARARGFIWAREKAKLPEFQNMPTNDLTASTEYSDISNNDSETVTGNLQSQLQSSDDDFQPNFDGFNPEQITITHL
ncbi:neurogenin-3-like [Ptychodera flava]|uniref:neurogenin-3-like n=1 Tax=Ptychodera flava TaxID=63121 RepID=UPI003969E772